MTVTNGTLPIGWVFYDADCPFCARGAARWSEGFARRGFVWLPLQTPGTAARLHVTEADLRAEMRLQLADGTIYSGIHAWLVLLRSIWWLRPLAAVMALPPLGGLAATGYRWIARHRHCLGGRCAVNRREPCRHSAFFEMP